MGFTLLQKLRRNKAPTNQNTSGTGAQGSVGPQPGDPKPLAKGRTPTLRDQAAKSGGKNRNLVKHYYKTYELDWEKLRDWLRDRFPNETFADEASFSDVADSYLFWVPRNLQESELDEIYRLRNDYRETKAPNQTPTAPVATATA